MNLKLSTNSGATMGPAFTPQATHDALWPSFWDWRLAIRLGRLDLDRGDLALGLGGAT